MKNLGTTIELDPKGDNITSLAVGLYTSPAEYSTLGHIVLKLTSLVCQSKSRERSARPTKHVTSALSQRKTAHPGRAQEMNEDVNEDDKPLVRPDRTADPEDEDDRPVVQPASREDQVMRESSAKRRVPTPLRRRKGPPIWRDPSATIVQDVSGNSRERAEEVSILGRNPDDEALRSIINKLSDERNLRDLHL